ncbi:MAG: hypothetical protein HC880_21185, partial [Bacteroidia bacterium]|nr:hypothetical protein [Bacteroidia bacterium]
MALGENVQKDKLIPEGIQFQAVASKPDAASTNGELNQNYYAQILEECVDSVIMMDDQGIIFSLMLLLKSFGLS